MWAAMNATMSLCRKGDTEGLLQPSFPKTSCNEFSQKLRNYSQAAKMCKKGDQHNRSRCHFAGRMNLVELIWLSVVAILISFLGYRLAQSYGLSGLTGLGIASAIYFVFVSDTWLQIYGWLKFGDNFLKALSGTVLISCAIVLAEKAKFFALFKLISLLAPVTATSVALPQYSSAVMRGEYGVSSLRPLWERSSPAPPTPSVVPREAIKDHMVTLARSSSDSPLYLLQDERFLQSTVRVKKESWVLVLSQIVGATGERWVNVMLPTKTGDFVLNDSSTGFLPLERIAERVIVPAPQ